MVLQTLSEPACTSSEGFCLNITFSGSIAGDAVFTATSIIPSVDTPTTGVIFITGDTNTTTSGGTLLTKDAISLSTTGGGEFAEIFTIIGGTGTWGQASGKFTATGTLSSTSGEGAYSGLVCTP